MDNMPVPDGFKKKNTFWLRSSGNIFQGHLGAFYRFIRQMLLLKSICLPDPFFPLLSHWVGIKLVWNGNSLMASCTFTTLTMNNIVAEEIKEKGNSSSLYRISRKQGMSETSKCSHKLYLWSIYWQERDSSDSPTTLAGFLFLILWDMLSFASDWTRSLNWD